ncbi:MAG TPA: acyl-CoA dehydrogenase family protein, partial [Steroidobacteraceae bacterium]|nr:acyl-CoA dehydrogenase family protein [Steroidobacteraceae bacterium]
MQTLHWRAVDRKGIVIAPAAEVAMSFEESWRAGGLKAKLDSFFFEHIHPNAQAYGEQVTANRRGGDLFRPLPLIEQLKPLAFAAGLWNLFLPKSPRAPQGLSNLEYAPLCEIMGRVPWSAEVFNCSAPDTGNMETLERYGTEEQKAKWLEPLLLGQIRSAFLMTEPRVASSDATNIECSIRREGDEYVINGRKWWSTGA